MYIHGYDFWDISTHENRAHSVSEWISITLTLILCKDSREGPSQYHVGSNFIAFSNAAKWVVYSIILRNWFSEKVYHG